MRGTILSYLNMCQKEGVNLQRGMNFKLKGYSVILMSVRKNSPYNDEIQNDGSILIYEGHDKPRLRGEGDPKLVDQPMYTAAGSLTENGKFFQSAKDYKKRRKHPELVQVYEKIKTGIWSDNGMFHLIDAWSMHDGTRNVFKFKLVAIDNTDKQKQATKIVKNRSRLIPTHVKLEVWARDKGKCVICGAKDELHFDHIVPYSKGGTSMKAQNIQLLCARHNLTKSSNIE